MYAESAENGEASTCCKRPHWGKPLMFVAAFVQCAPPSRVTETTPSSEPTQITFGSTGEMEIERIVSKLSAPLKSNSIGPPLLSCFVLSLRVRSGLIGVQCAPPSVDLKRTLPPR